MRGDKEDCVAIDGLCAVLYSTVYLLAENTSAVGRE